MAQASTGSPESREIRVFLSSTFRDFMQERDRLVKEVFPELRRKARERGVEVVDVDLRWGITEEESRQGKVIPICLGEIDRCRPYFVGMLGERYGWIPPADQYSPEVIERQPWLKEHRGGVSVTELEILHGVLNDPAMAGRAFFYIRDPAWSSSQSEPGFVCETAEEEAKLRGLKHRIRNSRFPVAENLPDPKALADQIGSDLWELIEQQYPDLDEANALEREERQHASYRRSRLGVYLGGKRSINQLERWIDADQQKILITGESGAGKSALIANWIDAHQQNHPEDVVLAHHLGCSDDASAIRPLLARLIDTAKQQLPEVYGYSLSVPQDWWELVAKAVEALQSLGRWAQQNNHHWIWVLDGLDRLDQDDQKALPWLPITIPEGVVIVTSALKCPAREILLERKCKTLTIAPLKVKEQDALIQQYLGRYTKQLIAELRQTILSHPLAGSPLFLRVLLEELRQCGRYETLAEQLTGYLSAETIDDLYERVLERLEADGNGENVRKVMTALWASRAGLSEQELLEITGLKPLQWAPIDLALEEALGRNGNRLVFDHDYLRKAVEDRYLHTDEEQRLAHSELADWFGAQDGWDARKAEEIPWQLSASQRVSDLQCLFAHPESIYSLVNMRGAAEIIRFIALLGEMDPDTYGESFRELIHLSLEKRKHDLANSIDFLDCLADFIYAMKGDAETLVMLREKAYEIDKEISNKEPKDIIFSMMNIASAYEWKGDVGKAVRVSEDAVSQSHHIDNLTDEEKACILNNFGSILSEAGDSKRAIEVASQARDILLKSSTVMGPNTASVTSNLGFLMRKEDLDNAEILLSQALAYYKYCLGENHRSTAISKSMLASVLLKKGKADEAILLFVDCLASLESMLGRNHPDAITTNSELAKAYSYLGNTDIAEKILEQSLVALSEGQGSNSSQVLRAVNNLATHYQDTEQGHKIEAVYNQTFSSLADVVRQAGAAAHRARDILIDHYTNANKPECAIPIAKIGLAIASQSDDKSSKDYLNTAWRLGQAYFLDGDFESSARICIDVIETASSEQINTDPDVMAFKVALSQCFGHLGDHFLALTLRKEHFRWSVETYGELHDDSLDSMHELGCALLRADQLDEAFEILTQCLSIRERHNGPSSNLTLDTLVKLLEAFSRKGMQKEGIELCKRFRREIKERSSNSDPRSINILISQAYLNAEIGHLDQARKLLSWFFVLARIYRNQTLGVKDARALMAQLSAGSSL